jgi:hypothetical protein
MTGPAAPSHDQRARERSMRTTWKPQPPADDAATLRAGIAEVLAEIDRLHDSATLFAVSAKKATGEKRARFLGQAHAYEQAAERVTEAFVHPWGLHDDYAQARAEAEAAAGGKA